MSVWVWTSGAAFGAGADAMQINSVQKHNIKIGKLLATATLEPIYVQLNIWRYQLPYSAVSWLYIARTKLLSAQAD